MARRGSPTLARQQPLWIAGKAPHRPQRHVAHDAGDTELRIVDELAGELLVLRKIGRDDARDVVDVAAHLPAFDHGIDGAEPLLEPAAGCRWKYGAG